MIAEWFKNEKVREIFLIVLTFVLIYFFWWSPVFYPLRLLETFFHESGHALATALTGGSVGEFVLNTNNSGHVIHYGGNRFLVSNAGYLGSFACGSLIYILAVRLKYDRLLVFLLGLSIGLLIYFFPAKNFTLIFGTIVALALVLTAKFAKPVLCDFVLKFIGLSVMMEAFLAVYQGIFLERAMGKTDAHFLSEELGGSPKLWAIGWMAIMAISFLLIMRSTFRRLSKKKQT